MSSHAVRANDRGLRNTWRMIVVMGLMSLLVVGASYAALRVAQAPALQITPRALQSDPPAAESGPAADDSPRAADPDLPMSADSNISFPIDI